MAERSAPRSAHLGALPLPQVTQIDAQCVRFEQALAAGQNPKIEDFLYALPPELQPAALRELLAVELHTLRQRGQAIDADNYRRRFADQLDIVEEVFREDPPPPAADMVARSTDRNPSQLATADLPLPKSATSTPEPVTIPTQIERYEIRKLLGEGGFGLVYLAHDPDLDQPVAIKLPNARRFLEGQSKEAFLAEARTAARLKHPGLVAVHDVREQEDVPYIVQEFIDGPDLEQWCRERQPSPQEIVRLMLEVIDAVGYAHQQGVFHRDLKPGNILIDRQQRPHVADFGLAIQEEVQRTRPGETSGSPPYMSPEQVNGESHRLDGRTDIWSLGVILYELLAGRRPFSGSTVMELLDEILHREPRPLRQINPQVPRELERICLKCLGKRQSERYASAADLLDDLRHFLGRLEAGDGRPEAGDRRPEGTAAVSPTPGSGLESASDSANRPPRIVPKGLRSFDEHDADFFLELLPGPRDREGFPDSIRFWKTRIEETDPDKTFAVGLLYGPSGCGKSSLVKAGLLPRLAGHVVPVYLEATADDTEARLLRRLSTIVPGASPETSLAELLRRLRARGLSGGRKVLLVLDQFEQWLHAHASEADNPLIAALRHCDGGQLQSLVMVRDDFWLAVSRFLNRLEVEIVENRNTALVDLFDLLHARKVLAQFGKAYGRLPIDLETLSAEQDRFLDQAVQGLSENGKVISVRLSLFAEMMKGRPWTAASLRAVGGTEGVGVTFLEETFSASTAPPNHRQHQKAARGVLKALLPEAGTDIKGNMRSREELLQQSGYAQRPSDFSVLINILDGELRLITPTEARGNDGRPEAGDGRGEEEGEAKEQSLSALPQASPLTPQASSRYYQLTHDYLVPSLREWLYRKQKETRRGRAEIRLAERAAAWSASQQNRHLPAWWEDLNIRSFVPRKHWTEPQRKMMRRAAWFYGSWTAVALVLLTGAVVAGVAIRRNVVEAQTVARAQERVDALLQADIAQVPGIIEQLGQYQKWTAPLLADNMRAAAVGSVEKLHLSLALLANDPDQVDYLYAQLLMAEPDQFPVIRDALAGHSDQLLDKLWAVLAAQDNDPEQRRLRAAGALAKYDPQNSKWGEVRSGVARQLVAVSPVFLAAWRDALRPVSDKLLDPLADIFRDSQQPELPRSLATSLLADYAKADPERLTQLVIDAEPQPFSVLFPVLRDHGEKAVHELQAVLNRTVQPEWPDAPANAAWQQPDAGAKAAIEAAHGILADRFAFCQDMPWDQFLQLAEELRPSGYRPTRVRPHSSRHAPRAVAAGETSVSSNVERRPATDSTEPSPASGETSGSADGTRSVPTTLVAAVWTRDGKRWELQTNLAQDQLPSADSAATNDGLLPADVAVLPTADESAETKYLVLWSEPNQADEQRRLVCGLSQAQFVEASAALARGGFGSQSTVHVSKVADQRSLEDPIPLIWSAKYFPWESAGPMKPPANWDDVVSTKPIREDVSFDLSFEWINTPPPQNIPLQFFAVVATSDLHLAAGQYRLQVKYDDGVRVYLDDQLMVDHWSYNGVAFEQMQFTATEGSHKFRVEYFQIDGAFALSVQLGRSSATSPSYAGIWSNQGAPSELMAAYGGWERVDQTQWDVSLAPAGRLADPLDRFRQQLAALEKAPPEQLDNPNLRLARAIAQFQLGQMQEALADLDFVAEKSPEPNPVVLQHRTLTLARLGKGEEARAELQKFVDQSKSPSTNTYLQVLVAAWLGEREQAAQQLEQAAVARDQTPNDLYNLACAASLAYQACVDTDATQAQKFVDRAMELLRTSVSVGWKDMNQLRTDPDLARLHADPRFRSMLDELDPPTRYAGVWRADVEFESRLLSDLTPEAMWEKSRELVAQGYRPVAISVAGDGGRGAGEEGTEGTGAEPQASPFTPQASSVWHRPLIPDARKEQLAKQQSIAAAALLRLETTAPSLTSSLKPHPPHPSNLFQHRPDPRLRSYLLHRLVPYECDPQTILARLSTEQDVSARRALLLAVGELAQGKRLPVEKQPDLTAELARLYADDPDPGIHGAAEWALRQLGALPDIDKVRAAYATGTVVGDRRWYLTKTGATPSLTITPASPAISLTMVILQPDADFLMGSPVSEAERFGGPTGREERRHRRRIGRRFAMAAHEVTVAQFSKFKEDHPFNRQYAPDADAPANGVSLYDAAAYCNWLSKEEGLSPENWCYDPSQRFADGMKLYDDYLQRTGFRLPTEAEWEYACRAGAVSARFFGETEELLGNYAWYAKNSRDRWMLPVGSLKPNDFGLFDMQGNAVEWCQDVPVLYPMDRSFAQDREQGQFSVVRESQSRVLRGGSFDFNAPYVRSATHSYYHPANRLYNVGFRPARTYP